MPRHCQFIAPVIAASLLLTTPINAADDSAGKGPLRHIVLFKFKDDAPKDQVTAIENAFAALPGKIDAIADFEWGTDVSVEGKNKNFTHCFVVTFQNEEDRAEYLPHPAHQEFVKLLRPSLEQVCVLDFFAAGRPSPPAVDKARLRHVVLVKFEEDAEKKAVKSALEKVVAMPKDIDLIKGLEWGVNNSPEGLSRGLTHGFIMSFDNAKDRDAYLPHPDHQEVVKAILPLVEDLLVIDYVSAK
jgi:hypothetical protein